MVTRRRPDTRGALQNLRQDAKDDKTSDIYSHYIHYSLFALMRDDIDRADGCSKIIILWQLATGVFRLSTKHRF